MYLEEDLLDLDFDMARFIFKLLGISTTCWTWFSPLHQIVNKELYTKYMYIPEFCGFWYFVSHPTETDIHQCLINIGERGKTK